MTTETFAHLALADAKEIGDLILPGEDRRITWTQIRVLQNAKADSEIAQNAVPISFAQPVQNLPGSASIVVSFLMGNFGHRNLTWGAFWALIHLRLRVAYSFGLGCPSLFFKAMPRATAWAPVESGLALRTRKGRICNL
jgi:hypothetical protein